MPVAARVPRVVGAFALAMVAACVVHFVPQIANSRMLHGLDLTAQSLVVSAGSNAAGMTISNAICLKVGS